MLVEDFGKEIVKDIHGQRPPKFKTVARTRSNIVYDKKRGFLTLGRRDGGKELHKRGAN